MDVELYHRYEGRKEGVLNQSEAIQMTMRESDCERGGEVHTQIWPITCHVHLCHMSRGLTDKAAIQRELEYFEKKKVQEL